MAAESNQRTGKSAIRKHAGKCVAWLVLGVMLTLGLTPGLGVTAVHAHLQAPPQARPIQPRPIQPRPIQARPLDVTGSVKDPHGDAIAAARIVLLQNSSTVAQTTTDDSGRFRFSGLGEGLYTLAVSAEGFSRKEETLSLRSGLAPSSLSIVLQPTIKDEVLLVEADKGVSLDPLSAAGAKVLKEKDLRALPDDPDQLSARLQLLASASGSVPGQAVVTVDGFLNEGRLPPKSSIREVRINPDLFSAEYDKAPYQGGRIEIYTKPGATAFQGSGFYNTNNAALNARNAFAPTKPPSSTRRFGFQLGGPIVPKRIGFLIDIEGRNINESTPVSAIVLDNQLRPAPFAANVTLPQKLYLGSLRVDWQVNSSNTLISRYETNTNTLGNQGAGGFNLPDRGADLRLTSQGLRFTETSILSKSMLNEARLGLTSRRLTQRAVSDAPAISVLGSFTSGGAANHFLNHEEQRIEAADSLSIVAGKHNLKFGAQIFFKSTKEARRDNGMFSFGGSIAPELDSQGGIVGGPGGPVLVNISGLEQYRRTLLGLPGGAPTRYSAIVGDAANSVTQWTIGGFAQDEWRLLPNLALSFGLRYEGQTSPSDTFRLAPRIGVAFSPDKKRNWVLRARAGIFYDRVPDSLILESLRLSASQQQQFIIDSPGFPNPFDGGAANNLIPTLRRLDAALRPPATLQVQLGFERQLPGGWKIEFSQYWTRNWSVLRSRNINAPAPGTDERPLGVQENILQFESSGKVRGQVLFAGANQAGNKFFNLYSGYLFFNFRSDTDSSLMLPQSSSTLSGEWARPIWQSSHRAFMGGTLNLPLKLRASTALSVASGTPFNITTGRDNNGDGNFNDRPGITTSDNPNAIVTRFGAFDPGVVDGSLKRNSQTNPYTMTLDVDVSRAFAFGKAGGSRDHRYTLTFNARASNVLNHTNVIGFNGVLSSPFFGRANGALGPREIEMGIRFSF